MVVGLKELTAKPWKQFGGCLQSSYVSCILMSSFMLESHQEMRTNVARIIVLKSPANQNLGIRKLRIYDMYKNGQMPKHMRNFHEVEDSVPSSES